MDVDEFIKRNGKIGTDKDAGIIKRLFAFIFDLLILNLISFTAISSAIPVDVVSLESTIGLLSGPGGQVLIAIILFAGIMALAYFALMEYAASATLGMLLFGLRVQGDVPFWKCVARNIFIIPFFPFTILWVVDPIYLIFKKRRFLEEITNTRTIVTNNV